MLDADENQDYLLTKIELLEKTNAKLERALNVEVWDGKRAKFIPFRETPEVVKVLQDDQSTGQVQSTQS